MSLLPSVAPMPPAQFDKPFEHPDWIFEPKLDGFRAVAYVENGGCRLVSRNRNAFRTFEPLAQAIVEELTWRSVILDGEIVHPRPDGRPMFYDLMRRRGPFCFYAFDLLWLDGSDLRDRTLLERKRLLRKLLPRRAQSALYVEHVASGTDLFRVICERDMEGIVSVGSRAGSPSLCGRFWNFFLAGLGPRDSRRVRRCPLHMRLAQWQSRATIGANPPVTSPPQPRVHGGLTGWSSSSTMNSFVAYNAAPPPSSGPIRLA